MNPHALLASFAVAAAASAAELKDPAAVAREWSEGTAQPPVFSADPGLKGAVDAPKLTPGSPGRGGPRIRRNVPSPEWGPIPRDKIYDAPNYRVPDVLPDNMPPGTKERKYGGGTYYLLPLIPAREK
jgi:hypothetical protein